MIDVISRHADGLPVAFPGQVYAPDGQGNAVQQRDRADADHVCSEFALSSGTAMSFKSAPDQLSFPKTLVATWPLGSDDLGADPSRENDLRHIAALGAVNTALTSLCQHVSRSMRSWESVPGMGLLLGRADSQGRVDLISTLTAKLEDFLNPAPAEDRRLIGAMSRSRP